MPDFSTLQTTVQTRVIDVLSEVNLAIPGWLNLGVKVAESRHNFNHMRKEHSVVTTVSSNALGSFPTGWKARRNKPYIVYNARGTSVIDWLDSEGEIVTRFQEGDPNDIGTPKYIWDDPSDVLEVFPAANNLSDYSDGNWRLTLPYWGKTTELVNPTDTNWFTDNADEYLINFALANAFLMMREEERALVFSRIAGYDVSSGEYLNTGELKRIVNEDKRRRFSSGQTLAVRSGVFGRVPSNRTRRRFY